jgi:electron transport complex protein RnfD
MLFSGGLFFGAIFMATDMVTSPVTNLGTVLYSVMIGGLVVVIRFWGGLPEGVQYSILFANGCVPLIDRAIQPRVYGTGKRSRAS